MKSRTVLITGAAKGTGAAIASKFAEKGYNIILHHNSTDISPTLERIKKTGCCVKSFKADLSYEKSIKELAEFSISEFCGLDVLVNNAGCMLYELFTDTNRDKWQRIFDINVTAPAMLSRYVLPHMISEKRGSIVNITSMWGETGASMEVAYSSAKAALIGFTKALAKEAAPSGIRVNAVSPGAVKTDMLKHLSQDEISMLEKSIPVGYTASPDMIASAVLFAAENSYITGQVIGVNGGALI